MSSLKPLWALALALVVSCTHSRPSANVPVLRVADGDTITVRLGDKDERVRLHGIDCPELGQAFGDEATAFTKAQVLGKRVRLEVVERDRYGRIVARVFTEDGTSVNEALVASGLAWHYRRYSKSATLARLHEAARQRRLGLWAGAAPVAPWEHRRKKRTQSR